MLSTGYTMTFLGQELTLLWMSPRFPLFFKVLAVTALLVLPLIFIFRTRFASWASRHLHWHLSPRTWGILAPALSIVSAIGLYFDRPTHPLIEWRFNQDGFVIRSLKGSAQMKWSEVTSARFDDRAPDPAKAALVLTSQDGKEAWFILEWLVPDHRKIVVSRIRASLPQKIGLNS